MSKDSVNSPGGLVIFENPAAVVAAARRLRDKLPAQGAGTLFLRVDQRSGQWVYGKDATPVGDAYFAIDPRRITHGYLSFGGPGKEPVGKMVPLGEDVTEADLPPLPAGFRPYSQAIALRGALVSADGKVVAPDVEYTAANTGGLQFCGSLIDVIVEGVAAHPETPVVVVTLGTDSYVHKTHGSTITVPTFEVVEWRAIEDTAPVAVDAGDEAKPGKPGK